MASATTALLTFVAIASVLPAFDGFVTNWHPPTYTDVTILVDPILEFAIFLILTVALCTDLICARAQTRRAHARRQGIPSEAEPNEMVVLPPDP